MLPFHKKRMECYHLRQHGWTQMVLCEIKDKDQYWAEPLLYTTSFWRAPHPSPNHLQKAPPPTASTVGFGVSAHACGDTNIHSTAVFEFVVSGIMSDPQCKCSIHLLSTPGFVLVEFVHRSFTTWKTSGAPHCSTNAVRAPEPAAGGPVFCAVVLSWGRRSSAGWPSHSQTQPCKLGRERSERNRETQKERQKEVDWNRQAGLLPAPVLPTEPVPNGTECREAWNKSRVYKT